MKTRTRRLMQAAVIAGMLAGPVACLPLFAADRSAAPHVAAARDMAEPEVVRTSYTTSDSTVADGSEMECPVEGSGIRGWLRLGWLRGCFPVSLHCGLRPYICASWYAHWDYMHYRLDALRCRPCTYYPANAAYIDPRDGQAYSAEGYAIPVSVPLSPVTGYTWNYGWGVPAARLTPMP